MLTLFDHKLFFLSFQMFNHNIKIMNNIRNYKSSIIQLLVRNYLEHKYLTNNIFIYPELVNDIDIFSTKLESIDVLSIDGKLNTNIVIQVMIDATSNESIQSCEIKSGLVSDAPNTHLFNFVNLLQLITKIKYPSNTKSLLILVPNIYEFNKSKLLDIELFEKLKNIELFEKLKNILLSESEENKQKIFNIFVNEKSFRSRDINFVLISVLSMVKNNSLNSFIEKLKRQEDVYVENGKKFYVKDEQNSTDNNIKYQLVTTYDKIPQQYKELTNDEYNSLIQNFEKLELKILTLYELEKYPLSDNIIKSLLSLY